MTEFAGEVTSSVRGSPRGRKPQLKNAVIVVGGHSVAIIYRRNPG